MDLKQRAQQILGLIDLTSLDDNDTLHTIENLCKKAVTPFGNVAAICIYPKFIHIAKQLLSDSNIKIATVINFPHGSHDYDIVTAETLHAINAGADEIDLVFPYHALIKGNIVIGGKMIMGTHFLCKNIESRGESRRSNQIVTLKVIIESGELKTPELIKLASEISIVNGADFIKTSTGKVSVNATLNAAEIMLKAIKSSHNYCGFKAAGGIKTVSDAIEYLELAEQIMGDYWINPNHFRFGASGLLDNVLAVLNNAPGKDDAEIAY